MVVVVFAGVEEGGVTVKKIIIIKIKIKAQVVVV